MGEKVKTICKLDKDALKRMLPQLVEEISSAQFVCRKCGRAARNKKLLCKAAKMADLRKD